MSFDDDDCVSNSSANPTFSDVALASRRSILRGGLGAAGLFFAGGCDPDQWNQAPFPPKPRPDPSQPLLGFKSVPVSTADAVVVPDGYRADVLYAWGDPVSNGPLFLQDASNSASDQERQAGMHHDGMHFFPLDGNSSQHGLLVVNHEYTDDGLLHVGGMVPWTADKVAKSQAAHGVSVVELKQRGDKWEVVRPSRYGRRITARTPISISGPAAGDPLLRTAADPTGTKVLGTINNCAHGHTPWGTYLTCEENWNGYFVNANAAIDPSAGLTAEQAAVALQNQKRYGLAGQGAGYRWHEFDQRFDASKHPNESNRFGWVVEFDPSNPTSIPVKRTALGRTKHEGAWVSEARDGRAVVYMGDDERFEYMYKFVTSGPWKALVEAGKSPLDHGTLFVAKYNADGTGQWIALTFGVNGLTPDNGFASQADVLVQTRRAADVVGATKMDRPEWVATDPRQADVYLTLTNNNRRAVGTNPGVDAANPRPDNVFGQIIRWREDGSDFAAASFRWEIFVLAGDPANAAPNKQGNIVGDVFGSPDGLWFDDDGRLWVQTDISTSVLNTGDYANIGNNQMLVADPATREIRRFLTGPAGCEVTGVITTPDGKSMFVNIQHPGEPSSERNDPANPKAVSSWPDGIAGGRPRAATIVIRKLDGGVIGS